MKLVVGSVRLFSAWLLAGPAAAVLPQGVGEGPFDGLPFVFSVRSGDPVLGGGSGADLLQKWSGVHTPGTATSPGRMGIVHDALSLDQATLFPGTDPALDIDAISFGADWVATDDFGVLLEPVESEVQWSALVFSVTEDTFGTLDPSTGQPGAIMLESFAPEGAGGDMFSFTTPGSQVASEDGRALLAQDSREFSLHATSTPSAAEAVEVDALDVFGSMFALDDDVPFFTGSPLTPQGEVSAVLYFSVSSASAHLIPDAWVGFDDSLKSGATVFKAPLEEGVSGWQWAVPIPLYAPASLGLGSEEEVDALAFDAWQEYLLFSTKTPGRDPLLFLNVGDRSAAPAPTPLMMPGNSTAVSFVLALGPYPGDVDAICALDPSSTAVCGPRVNPGPPACLYDLGRADLMGRLMGLPQVAASGTAPASMKAFVEPDGLIRLVLRDAPESDVALLLISDSNSVITSGAAHALISVFPPHGFVLPLVWDSSESGLQQAVGNYPITAVLTDIYLQTIGFSISTLTATYGSEILYFPLGIP